MQQQIVKLEKMAEDFEGLTRDQSIKKLASKLKADGSVITEDYIRWVMDNPN